MDLLYELAKIPELEKVIQSHEDCGIPRYYITAEEIEQIFSSVFSEE